MVWNQILQCKNIILIVGEQRDRSVMVDDSNSKNFLFTALRWKNHMDKISRGMLGWSVVVPVSSLVRRLGRNCRVWKTTVFVLMDGEARRVVKRRFRCEILTQLSSQTLAILEIIFEIYRKMMKRSIYLYFKHDFRNLTLNN